MQQKIPNLGFLIEIIIKLLDVEVGANSRFDIQFADDMVKTIEL